MTSTSTTAPHTIPISPNFSKLTRLDPEVMKLETWRLLYNNYIQMVSVAEDQKKDVFCWNLWEPRQRKCWLLCADLSPGEFTVNEFFRKLDIAYVHQRHKKRAEREVFFSTKQKLGETLIDFSNTLRNQRVKCEYPEAILHDQFFRSFHGKSQKPSNPPLRMIAIRFFRRQIWHTVCDHIKLRG